MSGSVDGKGPSIAQTFAGRLVLVTGGAGGIGRACAKWFVDRGARVVIADLGTSDLSAALNESGAASAIEIDVTDESVVNVAIESVRVANGPVGILVNAAGIVGNGDVDSMPVADWRRVLETNLTGTFLTSKAVISHLRAIGYGKIVNLSSVNARTGGNALSGAAYAAAKSGIEALTRHLAIALAPSIQVNAVAPGPVETQMLDRLSQDQLAALVARIPAQRVARPDEVASTVGFLASPESDYVTGTTVHQNGGAWLG